MHMHSPAHPGIILKEEFIDAYGLSISFVAKKIGITRAQLSNIVNQKGGISPELAFKLGKAFGTTPELWINLQTQYDTAQARKNVDLSKVEVISEAINKAS